MTEEKFTKHMERVKKLVQKFESKKCLKDIAVKAIKIETL